MEDVTQLQGLNQAPFRAEGAIQFGDQRRRLPSRISRSHGEKTIAQAQQRFGVSQCGALRHHLDVVSMDGCLERFEKDRLVF